ncbi:MAG: response regulator [Caldilineaceae bacterium]
MTLIDYILTLLTQFGGGAGGPQNEIVRFALAAIFFAILFGVTWSRRRRGDFPRERLLVWGFGLGLGRALFMFMIVSLQISGHIDPARLELFFPPFEHLLRLVALVLIAGAFLRFVLDDAMRAQRYLQFGLALSILAYLVTFWPWAQAVLADPTLKFGQHWGDWLAHGLGVLLLAVPILLLAKAQGWVRNVAILAFTFFFLDDFLMLFNLANAEVYAPIYGPIRHNLDLWAIPLLGYVYFREQANALQAAQTALKAYSEQLETRVAERTAALEERTAALEAQTAKLIQARDAAEVANRAKSEFLSNMNHELRSPLNAILGFARITTRNLDLPQDVQENLGIIVRSGEHLLSLINQVLDLAKIEAGQMTLNPVDFDLQRLLNTLDDMFALTAETKGLQWRIVAAPNLPRLIRGDEVKLRQVLINLVSNALKFTNDGGVDLSVTAPACPQRSSQLLRFAVTDTGPGIPAAEQERIFASFTQTTTGQQVEGGTGLGLPISREFVQLMQGTLTVASPRSMWDGTDQRPGACFQVEIPVVLRTGEAVELPARTQERLVVGLAPEQPIYRILVVDDKAVNRQLMVQLLAPLGFAVREAEDGCAAIAIWKAWQPHLIWMDMRMPVMDGYEAATQIKATTQGQATVVIALTASAFEEERALVLSAGCDDFLRKPFREADIFAMMSRHLGVRYQYAEAAPPSAVATHQAPQAVTWTLGDLPLGLRTTLSNAIATVDIEALETTIDQIRVIQPQVADNLLQLARAYDYAQLEQLLEIKTNGQQRSR